MDAKEPVEGARRYLKTREKPWAHAMARRVKAVGLTPNAISVLSVVFAIGAAVFLKHACPDRPDEGVTIIPLNAHEKTVACLMWLGAAACIQLRLLCNMLDGLVAIEGGMKSPLGGLYNEVPDRIADAVILMAAGYSNNWVVKVLDMPLGWIAAVLAVLTAYIRVLGGTLVGTQSFIGPMAKQHRMFVLTVACFGAMVEECLRTDRNVEVVMQVALSIIVVGSAITCWRRLGLISTQLKAACAKL